MITKLYTYDERLAYEARCPRCLSAEHARPSGTRSTTSAGQSSCRSASTTIARAGPASWRLPGI